MAKDLSSVVLVNDASRPDVAGDVMLFRNSADAKLSLEAIDVRNGAYYAFSLSGKKLNLTASSDDNVYITPSDDPSDYMPTVMKLLFETAKYIVTQKGGQTRDVLANMAIEDLVEFIGFDS